MLPVLTDNAYQALLADDMRAIGAEVVCMASPQLRIRRGMTVHLHWFEFVIGAGGRAWDPRPLARASLLIGFLIGVRAARGRVVWTMHNLVPHESPSPRRDLAIARVIMAVSNCTIVHSEAAATMAVARGLPRHGLLVLPHPCYPASEPSRPRDRIRATYGVGRDEHLFLAAGAIRPYKDTPGLIREFQASTDPRSRLLIVGACGSPTLRQELEQMAAKDGRVILDLRRLSDREFVDLHEGADAAVIHRRDLFSSGALVHALSLGTPVLASVDSAATELADSGGIFAFAPGKLSQAFDGFVPLSDADRADIGSWTARLSWREHTLAVLGEDMHGSRPQSMAHRPWTRFN